MRQIIIALLLMSPSTLGHANQKERVDKKTYKGLFVQGAEVRTFTPCGSWPTAYWVMASEKTLNDLSANYRKLTNSAATPYKEIYLEVEGKLGPKAKDGFAADYKGTFLLSKIVTSTKDIPENCMIPTYFIFVDTGGDHSYDKSCSPLKADDSEYLKIGPKLKNSNPEKYFLGEIKETYEGGDYAAYYYTRKDACDAHLKKASAWYFEEEKKLKKAKEVKKDSH
jgi:hypothetical protein